MINLLQLRSESGQAGVARPRGGRPIAWHGRDEDGILYQMRRGEERRGEEDSSETHGGGCLGRLSAGRRRGGETGAEAGHDDSDECRGRDAE